MAPAEAKPKTVRDVPATADAPVELHPETSRRAEPKPRPERNDRRSRGGSNDRNDSKVVGMGDHMPEFIALSFKDRRAS